MKQLVFIITFIIGFNSYAQTGNIKGKVTDEKGVPIPYTLVIIVKDTLGKDLTSMGVKTDVNGIYSFNSLKEGLYHFKAIYVGRKGVVKPNIEIIRDSTVILNFILQEIKNGVKSVMITAGSPKKRKSKIVNLYKPKQTVMGASGIRDVSSIAATAGGVVQSDLGEEISIAGGRSNGLTYFVNGVKMTGGAPIIPSPINTESYKKNSENSFKSTLYNPLSTFSIDVDKASYSNIRRMIVNKQEIPTDAVRIEEMVNYFDYHYDTPKNQHPLAIFTEYGNCLWNQQHKLLKVGMKAKEIRRDNTPPSNLVFLIDVSGSMSDYDKLPLLIQSLDILINQLTEKDWVSIVVYAGSSGVVLEPTNGGNKLQIKAALEKLHAGGSTAGGEGIILAYETAKKHFIESGNNRIILATDGDFNVGVSSDAEMEKLIIEKRKSGIYLTCLGFGEGNLKDSKLETLADKGNGNYFYIDNISEARKCFEKDLLGTIFTVAKDVKIQLEFNPHYIAAYRLVGYENRMLQNEDFKNDKIDAGELGVGHTVTALYEIIPVGCSSEFLPNMDSLTYNIPVGSNHPSIANVKVRYKNPKDTVSVEFNEYVSTACIDKKVVSEDYKFASAVAMFGMKISSSPYMKNIVKDDILSLIPDNTDNSQKEFREIVEMYYKK